MNGETTLQKLVIDKAGLFALGLEYSDEHLRRMEDANQFPKRIRLTPAKTHWIYQEIVDWIDEKAGARIR